MDYPSSGSSGTRRPGRQDLLMCLGREEIFQQRTAIHNPGRGHLKSSPLDSQSESPLTNQEFLWHPQEDPKDISLQFLSSLVEIPAWESQIVMLSGLMVDLVSPTSRSWRFRLQILSSEWLGVLSAATCERGLSCEGPESPLAIVEAPLCLSLYTPEGISGFDLTEILLFATNSFSDQRFCEIFVLLTC